MPKDASWAAVPVGISAALFVVAFGPWAENGRMLAITVFCIAL